MRERRTIWLTRCGKGHHVSGSGFKRAAALTLALGFVVSTAVFSTAAAAASGAALEVRVHPADYVYSYPAEQQRGLYSAVVQNVAVWSPDATLTLDAVEIQALRGGQPELTRTLAASDLDNAARTISFMSRQGSLRRYDFYFQTSRFLPDHVKLAATRTLEPGSAILITSIPMLLTQRWMRLLSPRGERRRTASPSRPGPR